MWLQTKMHNLQVNNRKRLNGSSGGLSQDFVGSGQSRVTAKKPSSSRAGLSHSAGRNITVFKFDY